MKTIYKYQIVTANSMHQKIPMPEGAVILSVGEQGGGVFVWALVDTDSPPEGRSFSVFGTGQPLPSNFDLEAMAQAHIGTVQQGPFVWHIFA